MNHFVREHLVREHFNKILCGKTEAAVADYSKELVCIAFVNDQSVTLIYQATMEYNLSTKIPFNRSDDIKVLSIAIHKLMAYWQFSIIHLHLFFPIPVSEKVEKLFI